MSSQRNDHGHLRKSNKCKMASYSKTLHNSVTAHLKSVNRANQKNSFHSINLNKQAKQNSEKTDKPAPPPPAPAPTTPTPQKIQGSNRIQQKFGGLHLYLHLQCTLILHLKSLYHYKYYHHHHHYHHYSQFY